MKKHLLIPVSAILICGTAMAQKNVLVPIKNKSVANRAIKAPIFNTDAPSSATEETMVPNAGSKLRSIAITNLGTSTYQLQTNGSVGRRINKNSDGTISATYTYSNTATWTERGTGYVYHNGTSWSAAPTAKVEPVKTGWPSILVLGDNSEALITHANAATSGNLYFSKRASKGTGAFAHDASIITSTAPYGDLWPRAVVGGPSNGSIHLISISNPTDGAATPAPVIVNGQQGCVTYSRSLDGGATWDQLHVLPPAIDATNYYGFGADSYSIDAKGNTIAFVLAGEFTDMVLMKSTDNGTTWTKTIITTFPIPFFNDALSDVNSDAVADTINTNDGSVSVLIDDNDDVHVWVGRSRILDDTPGDGLTTFFTGTDGLMYWNENMGASAPVDIAGMEDIDGDLVISVTAWGTYFQSLTSQPSTGIDVNNTIHLTYSSLIENTDFGDGKSFRNLYYMSSSDHGATWTTPVRFDPNDLAEQVFCSVARDADPTCVSMIYQTDGAPGTGVQSTSADYAANTGVVDDQWYGCLNPVVGVLESTNLSVYVDMFPNPSNTQVSVKALNTIDKIDVYNALGARVMSITPNANSATLNVANFTNGMYLVNIASGGRTISKQLIKE